MTADPELRHTQSGKAVATYGLAVNRQYKQEGQPEADFLNCVAWSNNAEFASKHLHKGTKIAVEGRIQVRNYENSEGRKVYVTEIIVERHEFCEAKSSGGNQAPQEYAGFSEMDDDDGDLPF